MKKAAQPLLLSIIIPAYKRQDTLDILLDDLATSVIKHDAASFIEVIIVDDHSSIAIQIPTLPFTCQLVRNPENRGAPYSRACGFKLSSARFIHFHDSDDSITEDWLMSLLDELMNHPETDLLVTGRLVKQLGEDQPSCQYSKIFHQNAGHVSRIRKKLIYQNCIGPLGGVTFSRKVLTPIRFMNFASCQDWQMYIDALKHAEYLRSRPDITYRFNIAGVDRISMQPRKKILGHLQLSRLTAKESFLKRNIRLFYLSACKLYILENKGEILFLYNKNKLKISIPAFLIKGYWWLIAIYWRFN